MSDDPLVTLRHSRQLKYCSSGMRAFAKQHHLDWQEFRERGLPASVFEATGDSMALAVAKLARQEQEGNH